MIEGKIQRLKSTSSTKIKVPWIEHYSGERRLNVEGVVARTCSPSTEKEKQGDLELEPSLGYCLRTNAVCGKVLAGKCETLGSMSSMGLLGRHESSMHAMPNKLINLLDGGDSQSHKRMKLQSAVSSRWR